MSDFLHSKYAKRRRICGMSRAENVSCGNLAGFAGQFGPLTPFLFPAIPFWHWKKKYLQKQIVKALWNFIKSKYIGFQKPGTGADFGKCLGDFRQCQTPTQGHDARFKTSARTLCAGTTWFPPNHTLKFYLRWLKSKGTRFALHCDFFTVSNIIWAYLFEKGFLGTSFEINFFWSRVHIRSYLDWDTFTAWKTFPEILVNRTSGD